MNKKASDIGVIIGRFQAHELHAGQKHLIDTVCKKHKRVMVFLGLSPVPHTKRNPLDFVTRQKMLQQYNSELIILPIQDMKSDKKWSETLDNKIREIFNTGSVMLYGSRDSFIKYYTGSFKSEELDELHNLNASAIREELRNTVKESPEFRIGVVYATQNQYDKVYPTVDVAPIRNKEDVLLCRKPNENKYRFIGGFASPKDESLEMAAVREFKEETSNAIEIIDLEYLCSLQVDDWRYRSENDKIITTFFTATYNFGNLEPSDDIAELKWFNLKKLSKDDIVAEHRNLLKFLKHKTL